MTLPYIVEQYSKEKYSEPLIQNSNIFSVGTGKDANGNEINVSNNVEYGQISDVVLKGLTATNIVKNGNFSDGVNKWVSTNSNSVVLNNTLSNTITSLLESDIRQSVNKSFKTANKIFIRAKMRVTNSECTSLGIFFHNGTTFYKSIKGANSPVQNQWYVLSEVHAFTQDIASLVIRLRQAYASPESALGKVLEIQEVFAIDLTSLFGVGNEPTTEQCNQIFPNYFDGTKSTVSNIRLVSVGNNLQTPENMTVSTNTMQLGKRIKVDHAKKIYISYSADNIHRPCIRFYDAARQEIKSGISITPFGLNIFAYLSAFNGRWATGADLVAGNYSITIDGQQNIHYIEFGVNCPPSNALITSKMYVSQNVPTQYEPFKENVIYINGGELRSLPNGVNDEVNVTLGQKFQRVSGEIIIDGTKTWTSYNAYTNTYAYFMPHGFSNYIGNASDSATARSDDGGYSILGWPTSDTRNININSNGNLYVHIEKTKIDAMPGADTLTKFKAYLNQYPITLNYQLNQVITTPIDVDGELQCFENGTIYIEPYIKKEFTYNNGITFTYPVSAIDKIKMNVNGEFKEITNTVTLAQDGLSATVANITNGTVLTVYAPIKPEYSTIPTTVIQYPTNTKSVIYGTHALANKNAVILDDHESMLLGLSLNYIDLVNKVSDLETRVATLEEPEIPEG